MSFLRQELQSFCSVSLWLSKLQDAAPGVYLGAGMLGVGAVKVVGNELSVIYTTSTLHSSMLYKPACYTQCCIGKAPAMTVFHLLQGVHGCGFVHGVVLAAHIAGIHIQAVYELGKPHPGLEARCVGEIPDHTSDGNDIKLVALVTYILETKKNE